MRKGDEAKRVRRLGALERLRSSVFFEKGTRTEEAWQDRKNREISILEKRV